MNETAPTPAVGGLAGWQVRTLRHLAAAQLPQLTAAGLAAAVNLSPHHFSRAFKATFGVPPRDWLLQLRLEKAKERLLYSADTVDQIALDVGYKNGSQFSRMFRTRVGVSPLAFRRA